MQKVRFFNTEKISALLIWILSLAMLGFFIFMLAQFVWRGFSGFTLDFLFEAPESAGRKGGIGPIIVSTLCIVGICMAVAVPIGLGTAILLSEFSAWHPRFLKVVRYSLDILAGVPSIIFGLFGSAFFCGTLKLGFSLLAGGLTLACMVLPIFIRSVEIGLRSIATEDRLSGAALALSKSTIIFQLLIPAAMPGILMGFILGVGRAIAETAALIFTSGYVDRMPSSIFDSGRALSVHIFDLSMNVPGGDRNAYKSTLVIITLIIVINIIVTSLSDRWVGKKMVTTCKI
jgi:phosphate transport system permease protein